MAFDSVASRAFPDRRIGLALALSAAIHALLLWSPAPPLLTNEGAAVLVASLRPHQIAPAAMSAANRLPPRSALAPAVSTSPRATVSAMSPTPTFRTSSAAPAEAAPATPVEEPAVSPGAATSAATSVATAPASASSRAAESAPVLSSGAADGLRAYRLALASQARRFKRYPGQAMAAGWQGTAEVRLDVGSDGRPAPAQLARSSGYESLDRAALAMIDAAALRAVLPDGLRGYAFAVMLPVVFNLDDAAARTASVP